VVLSPPSRSLCALYFRVLHHDSKKPHGPDRDRFILSKGHAAPPLYAAARETGAIVTAEEHLVHCGLGISVGEDGISAHAIEDLALVSSLPGFRVIVPADAVAQEARRLLGWRGKKP
jgi:transketolase